MEALILVAEMADCFVGVHVKYRLADGGPLSGVEKEDSRGIAQIADGGQPLHIAAGDSFKQDCHTDQGSDLARLTLTDVFDTVLPLAVFPDEAARFTSRGGSCEELRFEALALQL